MFDKSLCRKSSAVVRTVRSMASVENRDGEHRKVYSNCGGGGDVWHLYA
jgi:hypothetical protein